MAETTITIPKPPTPQEKCEACGVVCCPVYAQCITDNTGLKLSDVTTSLLEQANDELIKCLGQKCFDELCSQIEFAKQTAQIENSTNWIQFVEGKWQNVLSNRNFKLWYSRMLKYFFLCSDAGQKEITIKDEKAGREIKTSRNDKKQIELLCGQIETSLSLFISGCWNDLKNQFECCQIKTKQNECSPCGTNQNKSKLGWCSGSGKTF